MSNQINKQNNAFALLLILIVILSFIFVFLNYKRDEKITKTISFVDAQEKQYREDWLAYSKLSPANKFAYDNYAFCKNKNDSFCRGNTINLANILEDKEFAKEVNQAILKFDDRKVNHAAKN